MKLACTEAQDAARAERGGVPAVAVSGCGAWGRNLVRTLHGLGALAAVNDPDTAVAGWAAREYGTRAQDFDAILRDPEIDAVVIAAPASEHGRLARRALEAGKHVFVEKPLALDVGEAEELCAMAEADHRVLMVGHLLQYHPAFRALTSLVDEGALGRLQYLYSNRLNFGRVRREENILWSFAPHDISMMLRLAGSEPDGVSAVGWRFLNKEIADVTTTHLSFPNGVQGDVFVSWLHPFKEQKLVVIGESGMAVFDDGEPWETKLRHYPHEVSWREGIPELSKADAVPVAVEPAEPLVVECEHFLSCVSSGSVPRTDGREGIRVLRVLDAAERSMRAVASSGIRLPETSSESAFVHETAIVDQPSEIGEGTKVWHFSHVLAGSRIGRNCVLGQNVMVGPDVTIGDNCKIQNNVSLFKGVTLEDDVFCGPSAVFTNVGTPRARVDRRDEFAPTTVERGASIGANATIVCGNTIGSHSLIGAGAVVTGDVPAHGLMVGVPARRIGWVSHDGERLGDDLTCPRSGRRYREARDGTLEEITSDSADDQLDEQPLVRLLDLAAQRARLGHRIERAVERVVKSDRFILGPEVAELEERLSEFSGAGHAVSCGNGTDALVLLLMALDVRPGDAVFVPGFTFAATAEAVALVGATPVFVDVRGDTFNVDPSSLERALAEGSRSELRPVGVIAVDLFGQPAEYQAITEIADRHRLWVLDDGAQSFGATLGGREVGTLAYATALSFFPSKPLGCYGDGGAVLTDDPSLASTLRSLRAHGQGTNRYLHERVGMNSRLDTLQAAVLLEKLTLLPEELCARQQAAEYYNKALADVVTLPFVRPDVLSAWAQYTIQVDARRDQVAAELLEHGVQTAVHYPRPLHRQPAYEQYPRVPGGLPVSEGLASTVLSLPMHPYLDEAAQERVVTAVQNAVGATASGRG